MNLKVKPKTSRQEHRSESLDLGISKEFLGLQ